MHSQKNQKNIYLLISAYFFVVVIFTVSFIKLPVWMQNLEINYAATVQQEIQEILETSNPNDIEADIKTLREDKPFEIAIYKDDKQIYQSVPKLTLVELRSFLQEEAVLLEASGDVKTEKNGIYYVWYNIYHPTITTYLENVTKYQMTFMFIGFTILFIVLLLTLRLTIKPLRILRERIFQLEAFDLEEAQEVEEATDDVLNDSLSRFAVDLENRFRSISRNYTDLEMALQLEKERLSNLLMISRGLIHDFKSPLHQTLIENDLFIRNNQTGDQAVNEIAEYNIERMDKMMVQINDVLNLLDTDVKEMLESRQDFDIVRLLKEIRRGMNTYRMQKDLSVDVISPEELPVTLNKAAMHLIMHNMLSNAMKYAIRDTEITFTLIEENGKLLISCTNESTLVNIERMRQSEELFFMESEEDKTGNEDDPYSSSTGIFIIRELTYIFDGKYEVIQKGNSITIQSIIPLNAEVGDMDV